MNTHISLAKCDRKGFYLHTGYTTGQGPMAEP